MAVFYASGAGSKGTGDGSSEANACTLQQAVSNDPVLHTPLVAGSTIWVKNDAKIVYNSFSDGNIVSPTITGTQGARIRLAGYATTPGDRGVVEIQDTDTGFSGSAAFSFTGGPGFWTVENFKVIEARRAVAGDTSANGLIIINVEADTTRSYGFDIAGGTGTHPVILIDCMAHGSLGAPGFQAVWRNARLIRCVSINNNGHGFQFGNSYGAIVSRCVAHGNTGDGFHADADSCVLEHCVSNGNSGDGIDLNGTADLIGCVCTNNGGYGLRMVADSVLAIRCAFNPTNAANTSGKSVGTGPLVEFDEITGDPLFSDDSPASPLNVDLTTGASSSLRAVFDRIGGAGFASVVDALDAGAYQAAASGGGSPVTTGYAI